MSEGRACQGFPDQLSWLPWLPCSQTHTNRQPLHLYENNETPLPTTAAKSTYVALAASSSELPQSRSTHASNRHSPAPAKCPPDATQTMGPQQGEWALVPASKRWGHPQYTGHSQKSRTREGRRGVRQIRSPTMSEFRHFSTVCPFQWHATPCHLRTLSGSTCQEQCAGRKIWYSRPQCRRLHQR